MTAEQEKKFKKLLKKYLYANRELDYAIESSPSQINDKMVDVKNTEENLLNYVKSLVKN